jgi:hypothetical protein
MKSSSAKPATSVKPFRTNDLADLGPFRKYLPQLQGLGISTLEAFRGAAQVARPELAAYLNTSIDDLFAAVPATPTAIPQAAMKTIQQADYPLGVALDQIPKPLTALAVPLPAASPPASVNHIPQMPPIRNQGERGTCVAFAALAAYEHALTTLGAFHDLAEQFLYWNCKRNDGIHNSIGVAYPLLKQDGCCLEETWPYYSSVVPGNEGQGPSPKGSQLQALTYRLSEFQQLSPNAVEDIKAKLAAGRCVSFSIPVFNSWYRSDAVAYTGDITNPIPGEVRNGGHAMCFVGYIDSAADVAIGGGRFIVRNSWGSNWGIASPFGVGYGTIPYSYITRFATEAFSPN